ncbi:hypothetical protein ACHAP8_009761 [Fusarium lateritium]
MTPRRSARIAAKESAVAPTQPHTLGKRKAHSSNEAHRLGRKKKKVQVRSKNSRALTSHGRHYGQPAPDDALSVLPAEIQQNILAYLKHSKSLINLAITSKRYYAIAMPIIHNSVAVEVHYDPIAEAIRLLEPHLSITQKKQLKKMEYYKGLQERFSSRLDQDAVPGCAKYVRQMTIGTIDPEESRKKVVMKTLEEALKNLTNLEVLDTTEWSASMASSIVALKTLKALHIRGPSISTRSLSQLRDLKHLSISNMRFGLRSFPRENSLKTMILNSSSTLESLAIRYTRWPLSFDNVGEDGVLEANTDSMNESPIFPALKSLMLTGPSSVGDSETCLSNILRSVNFLQLRKLKMMRLEEGKMTFFKSLENSFNKADVGTIRLRHLVLDMHADQPNALASEVHMEGICRFIASFDTLTSLEIHNHNTLEDRSVNNSGISSRLQQVIIMHKGLESLRFRYTRRDPAYASVNNLRVLTQDLPRLRVLEIQLQDKDLDGIARSILRARNLETLICSTFNIRNYRVNKKTFCIKMIESLLNIADENGEFVWEKAYCLKHMALGDREFVVGSYLQQKLYMSDPELIIRDDRLVWVQEKRLLWGSKTWASQIMTSV